MACHSIFINSEKEFFIKLKERDPELLLKMVKCVISAHKRKRPSITIFDVTFKDMSSLFFKMEKQEYKDFLSNCLQDMINIEEYEICVDIKKIIATKTRKTRSTQK